MTDLSLQLNPELSHAVRGTPTPQSSGSPLSATTAADRSGFCFAEYERSVAPMMWRINLQILGMQMGDYKQATSQEEKQLCKNRIWESLCRLNQKAQMFNPVSLPSDIPAPTAEYLALSVTGNWCLQLTQELTLLFTSACLADITKIETAITSEPLGLLAADAGDMSISIQEFTALG